MPVDDSLKRLFSFLAAWVRNPSQIGALFPSTPRLGHAIVDSLMPLHSDGPIFELGPGTGVVTDILLRRGISPDRLVLLEYDKNFCAILRQRFPDVMVIQGDAYKPFLLPKNYAYAHSPLSAVISSLPICLKTQSVRNALLLHCFNMMSPQAPFIQFSYSLYPPIQLQDYQRDISCSRKRVWLNLPPASVWAYRKEIAETDFNQDNELYDEDTR